MRIVLKAIGLLYNNPFNRSRSIFPPVKIATQFAPWRVADFARQQGGERGGGSGFDDLFGAGHDEFQGGDDFVFGDEDDVVGELADDGEGKIGGEGGVEAVGDRFDAVEFDRPARFDGAGHGRGT